MASWVGLKHIVETNGNVMTVTMETLRDANGSGKLGDHVLTQITQELAGVGLGHVPQKLFKDYRKRVRIYKFGTPVATLIGTVLNPGEQNDQMLTAYLDEEKGGYAVTLQQIRELVAE